MKACILGLGLILAASTQGEAQVRQDSARAISHTKQEQEVVDISKKKWQ